MNKTRLAQMVRIALAHDEIAFALLCVDALAGEEWAIQRVESVLRQMRVRQLQLQRSKSADRSLDVIHATDTTRPDGATARVDGGINSPAVTRYPKATR